MNHSNLFCSVLGAVCLAGAGMVYGAMPTGTPATSAAAAASASPAASGAQPAGQSGREQPPQSPAVRAAQSAATPGSLRPQSTAVPQLAVPLRPDRDAARGEAAASSGLAGAIHDTAARCKAATNDRERAACIRSGNVQGTAPKR